MSGAVVAIEVIVIVIGLIIVMRDVVRVVVDAWMTSQTRTDRMMQRAMGCGKCSPTSMKAHYRNRYAVKSMDRELIKNNVRRK